MNASYFHTSVAFFPHSWELMWVITSQIWVNITIATLYLTVTCYHTVRQALSFPIINPQQNQAYSAVCKQGI